MVSSQPVGIPADDLAILHVQKVAVLPGASSPRAGGRSLAARLTPCPQPKKRQLANALFGQAEQSGGRGYFIRSAASLPGYRQDVELRQLEAFVAVATELHFGRAAERLHLAAPTLSELIRRLERELGTPLFTRTTRQVAITSAGAELLTRATVILDEVAAAKAAMRRVADGEAGTVRLGITPPAAPVLAPHLIVSEPAGIATEVFCAEPVVVGLRPSHRLASRDTIALSDLAHEVLGIAPEALFPAWALAQRQALDTAGIAPPTIELADTDLAEIRWADQPGIDWILLIPSLAAAHTQTIIRPVTPRQLMPFTLQWNPSRVHTIAVARFVHCALAADLPPGWHTQPDHLHHTEPKPEPGRTPTPASTAIRLRPGKLTPRRNERAGAGGPVWTAMRPRPSPCREPRGSGRARHRGASVGRCSQRGRT